MERRGYSPQPQDDPSKMAFEPYRQASAGIAHCGSDFEGDMYMFEKMPDGSKPLLSGLLRSAWASHFGLDSNAEWIDIYRVAGLG